MDLGNINGLDAALTVLILASAIFGMFRGMIRGVFGVIALVLAFLAAKKYGAHPMMVQGMTSVFGESAAVTLAGVALVFTASLLAFSALTFMLHKFADEMDLGFSDKSGGFFFRAGARHFFRGAGDCRAVGAAAAKHLLLESLHPAADVRQSFAIVAETCGLACALQAALEV